MSGFGADISILIPAMIAGLLVLATHVPLGTEVLRRGIVFIDLAIAQIAALGVIAADFMGWGHDGWQVQLSAVTAALLGALLLTWTEKVWSEVQEAIIGALFVLAASGSILLLAHNAQGGEHLRDLLVGQILWVGSGQLVVVGILTVLVLALWFGGGAARLGRAGFYCLFSVSVTAAVQLVGVYLVFASLILPALATRQRTRWRIPISYATGAAGYGGGLALSAAFDLPAGAVIVWTMACAGIFVFALGRVRTNPGH